MSYTPKNWIEGDIIYSGDLNHLEQGVKEANQRAANPFKGWWPDFATLKATITARPGDSAYVKDASPATTWSIFIYDSTALSDNYWADSGTDADTSDVQTFATSEKVNETPIDNTHLANPADGALPTADDVMQLKAKLEGVTASEEKVIQQPITGFYVQGDNGSIKAYNPTAYLEIELGDAKLVRFLGGWFTSSSYTSGYAFGHYTDPSDPTTWVTDKSSVFDTNASTLGTKEYIIVVPEGATHFRTTTATGPVPALAQNFYCYLQNGESVIDLIPKAKDNLITDDRANSLSASQGFKLLKDNYIFEKIETMTSNYPRGGYIISSTGKWSTSTSYWSSFVEISQYEYIRVQSKDEYPTRIAFLKDKVVSVSTNPNYCDGTSLIEIPVSTLQYYKVPADANYLYVFSGPNSSPGNLPKFIEGVLKDYKTQDVVEAIKDELPRNLMKVDLALGTTFVCYIVNSYRSAYPFFGRWYSTSNYQHFRIDIDPSIDRYIEIKAGEYNAYYSFLSASPSIVDSGALPPYAEGCNRTYPVLPTETVIVKVPADAVLLYIFAGSTSSSYSNTPEYVKSLRYISDTLDRNNPTDILSLNPESVIKPKLFAMRKGQGGLSSTGGVKPSPFVFSHITDCHGITSNQYSKPTWLRYLRFSNYYKDLGYIDELIDTGDIVADKFSDSIDWRVDADNVVNVIGNHDTAVRIGGGYDWDGEVGINAYNKFFAPYIENWGVEQPTDAATLGLCYFYKDYTRTSVYGNITNVSKLRAIYVDVMGWNDDEKTWFDDILAGALANNMVVTVIAHFAPVKSRPIRCSYTSRTLGIADADFPYASYNNKCQQMVASVYNFQAAGGSFACYIAGHRHIVGIAQIFGEVTIDGVQYDLNDETKPQLIVYGSAGYVNLNNLNDYRRVADTNNQDNFQLVAIDAFLGDSSVGTTANKVVKAMKIGCNFNRHMQNADVVAVSYGAINPFDEDNLTYKEGNKVTYNGVIYRFIKPVYINSKCSWNDSVKEVASRLLD